MTWKLPATCLLVTSVVLAGGFASFARADSDDQDRASEALERAEVLPLAQLLPKIEAQYGARLLAVKFHKNRQDYIYELELITPDGRLIELVVNAANGTVLPESSNDHDDADDKAAH